MKIKQYIKKYEGEVKDSIARHLNTISMVSGNMKHAKMDEIITVDDRIMYAKHIKGLLVKSGEVMDWIIKSDFPHNKDCSAEEAEKFLEVILFTNKVREENTLTLFSLKDIICKDDDTTNRQAFVSVVEFSIVSLMSVEYAFRGALASRGYMNPRNPLLAALIDSHSDLIDGIEADISSEVMQ